MDRKGENKTMRKIAVSLSKGGVGKTTTAINLAHGLAIAGERVLLVDCDTQGQSAKSLGVDPEVGLADLLSERVKPQEALFVARERLWLLAGGRALAGAKREIDRRSFGGEMALSEALEHFEGQFDFVIMDTAPSLDILSINVLFYGREILTPVSPDVLTLHGVIDFQQSIAGVQKYNRDLEVKYIVPTFYDLRVKKSQEILAQLKKYFPDKLCEPIKYNVRLSEAPGYGQTIYEYDPKSAGAQGYRALTEKVRSDGR